MPGFGRDLGDLRDLGILLLPVGSVPAGIPAVQLPTAGYLDQLKASGQSEVPDRRNRGLWRDAGLGAGRPDAVHVRRRPALGAPRSSPGSPRRWCTTTSSGTASGPGSGVCFGDSGSPQFDVGTLRVLSVTSGGNGQCNANNLELPGRHAPGAGVPRAIPVPARRDAQQRMSPPLGGLLRARSVVDAGDQVLALQHRTRCAERTSRTS